jgi:hypothetical protein
MRDLCQRYACRYAKLYLHRGCPGYARIMPRGCPGDAGGMPRRCPGGLFLDGIYLMSETLCSALCEAL